MGYKHAVGANEIQDALSILGKFVESSKRLAVVCLGNELRGDDVAGKIVCEQLAGLCGEKLYIVYAGQDAARVIGLALEGYNVLVVDAVVYREGKVGDIVVATTEELSEDDDLLPSTHILSIPRFACYLKSRLLVVGINVNLNNLGLGDQVSEDVVKASHALADLLASILRCRE